MDPLVDPHTRRPDPQTIDRRAESVGQIVAEPSHELVCHRNHRLRKPKTFERKLIRRIVSELFLMNRQFLRRKNAT
jgi:hypothetical protein